MIIGPAGFMHAPKAPVEEQSPRYLDELWVGQRLVIRVGMGDDRVVEVTKINMEPGTIHGFKWKDAKRRTGWAYVDQIL
jgi:hypothetical protein